MYNIFYGHPLFTLFYLYIFLPEFYGMKKKTAFVTGANGITGRNAARHLLSTGKWNVVVSSHSPLNYSTTANYLQMDLTVEDAVLQHAEVLKEVTHVFYGAYVERPALSEHTTVNTRMLQHLVEGMEAVADGLEHVQFIQGGKAYGAHFGLYKTPALETDPRHFPPNFYYSQEDYLRQRSSGKSWNWSAIRPDLVFGIATGNPMNLASVIAAYATLCKALNVPFRFPGTPQAYDALLNVTDAGVLAKAMEWAALHPAAQNEIFNITNGDIFRWNQVWPQLAEFFDVPVAPPQPFSLELYMADKAPLWKELTGHSLERFVQWGFGDFIFGIQHDAFFDVNKARRSGFYEMPGNSAELMIGTFREMRREGLIP